MTDSKRILFVWPGAEFSIYDVGRGFHSALVKAGHDVKEYLLTRRMMYHGAAMQLGGLDTAEPANQHHVSKQASENVIVEALYHRADLVVLVCGLNFHPLGLMLLDRIKIPTAVILTESPYADVDQLEFVAANPNAIVFTNDRVSALRYGWQHLPCAYDAAVHQPRKADPSIACDVLFIGTGWPERVRLFERVNWSGISLRLLGTWPGMANDHPLRQYVDDVCVPNNRVVDYYASAKVVVNLHRASETAHGMNPRCYEVAACAGALLVSDVRGELVDVFGDAVPTFDPGADVIGDRGVETVIRRMLSDDVARQRSVSRLREAVQPHNFDVRASTLMTAAEHFCEAIAAR